MKQIIRLMICLGCACICFAQEIVENPEIPDNPRVGRVVALTKIYTISDQGGEFYFRYPSSIYLGGPEESIFIQDWDHFYQFDAQGNYLRDIFKKGEGPGEMMAVSGCSLERDYIILYSSTPPKMMWFDYDGQLHKEFTLPFNARRTRLQFLLFRNQGYFYLRQPWPVSDKEQKIMDTACEVISLEERSGKSRELINFPVRTLVYTGSSGARGLIPIARFHAVRVGDFFLAVTHTSEYMVNFFNLESGNLEMVFSRRYPRIKWNQSKHERGGIIAGEGKRITTPRQPYENDIRGLLSNDDHLWVLTSTWEKDKGVLVDIFDLTGKYVDQFYLQMPSDPSEFSFSFKRMAVFGGFLFMIETDEDDLPVVNKYRLQGLK